MGKRVTLSIEVETTGLEFGLNFLNERPVAEGIPGVGSLGSADREDFFTADTFGTAMKQHAGNFLLGGLLFCPWVDEWDHGWMEVWG